MKRLRPCPFCGGDARLGFSGVPETSGSFMSVWVDVRYRVCGARVKPAVYNGSSIAEENLSRTEVGFSLIGRWNTRTEDET